MARLHERIFTFVNEHLMDLVTCQVVVLFMLWSIGYILNGIYPNEFKFELSSAWSGLAAIGVLSGTSLGRKYIDVKKYEIASIHNSENGQEPK